MPPTWSFCLHIDHFWTPSWAFNHTSEAVITSLDRACYHCEHIWASFQVAVVSGSPLSFPATPPLSLESFFVSPCWITGYSSSLHLSPCPWERPYATDIKYRWQVTHTHTWHIFVASIYVRLQLQLLLIICFNFGCVSEQGSLTDDCFYATFLSVCSWCQMAREIKRRKTTLAVVNAQPALIGAQQMHVMPGVVTSQPIIAAIP